jgi:hypothetical protein
MPNGKIALTAPRKGHVLAAVRGLVEGGWVVAAAPAKGRLTRNGQLLSLETPKQMIRIRLFVYKVTESSRGKPEERRVEITSTYQKGLKRKRGYQDVVLGIDVSKNVFVGVDPRRIRHGGPTGNASSFFDRDGLDWNRADEMLIRPRRARLFAGGIEYHAFLASSCLADYFFNTRQIHSGLPFELSAGRPQVVTGESEIEVASSCASGNVLVLRGPEPLAKPREVPPQLVTAFEIGARLGRRTRQKLSPGELLAIKRRCEENGHLGEELVLRKERLRLRRSGKPILASRVRWVSLESVAEGYDILSFENDETERFIEVKSTEGTAKSFEMSDNEWKRAEELGDRYWLYRVTRVRTRPKIRVIRNPWAGLANGTLKRDPSGWLVRIL